MPHKEDDYYELVNVNDIVYGRITRMVLQTQ